LLVAWLVVALLLLELGALLIQLHRERANPYIIAFRNGSPIPSQPKLAVNNDMRGYYPQKIGGWDSLPNNFASNPSGWQVYEKSIHNSEARDADGREPWTDFAGLTDEAKEIYAVMRSSGILALDNSFSLQETYGPYKGLFEGCQKHATLFLMRRTGAWEDVCNGLRLAEQQGNAQEIQTTFPVVQTNMFPLEALCLPPAHENGKGMRRYVIYKAHPDKIAETLMKQMPEDSLWDIPFYRYKPALNNPSFSTNGFGLRSGEIIIPKPEKTFRILCIGGSTTEEGSSNETTYPSLLESCLQQHFPDRIVEVVNAGVSGITSDWHLLRLQDYLKFDPDLVIMHLGVNDIWRRYNTKWLFSLLASHSHFIHLLLTSMGDQNRYDTSLDNTRLCLELMTMFFQQHGAAVAFASIAHPSLDHISSKEAQYYNYQAWSKWELPSFSFHRYVNDIESSNKMLEELSKSRNAFYIPVAETITGTTNIFWDFCHLTQDGITIKAAIMCEFVKEILDMHDAMN